MENENDGDVLQAQKSKKNKGKHDKPKPWDEDRNIDHWKTDKFDPSWNESGLLEVSSFSTLFPQYREKYLQEIWPPVSISSVGTSSSFGGLDPGVEFP